MHNLYRVIYVYICIHVHTIVQFTYIYITSSTIAACRLKARHEDETVRMEREHEEKVLFLLRQISGPEVIMRFPAPQPFSQSPALLQSFSVPSLSLLCPFTVPFCSFTSLCSPSPSLSSPSPSFHQALFVPSASLPHPYPVPSSSFLQILSNPFLSPPHPFTNSTPSPCPFSIPPIICLYVG